MESNYLTMDSSAKLLIEGGSKVGLSRSTIVEAIIFGCRDSLYKPDLFKDMGDDVKDVFDTCLWMTKQLKLNEKEFKHLSKMPHLPSDDRRFYQHIDPAKDINEMLVMEMGKFFEFLYPHQNHLHILLTPSVKVINGTWNHHGHHYIMMIDIFMLWWKYNKFVNKPDQERDKNLAYLITVFEKVESSIHHDIKSVRDKMIEKRESGKQPHPVSWFSFPSHEDYTPDTTSQLDDSDFRALVEAVGHSLDRLVNVYRPAKAAQALLAEKIDLPTLTNFLNDHRKQEESVEMSQEAREDLHNAPTPQNHLIRSGWMVFMGLVLMDADPEKLYNTIRAATNPSPEDVKMDQYFSRIIQTRLEEYVKDPALFVGREDLMSDTDRIVFGAEMASACGWRVIDLVPGDQMYPSVEG